MHSVRMALAHNLDFPTNVRAQLIGMANLCQRISPSFDQSRLCIKVASTWEGLQACRKLSGLGIRTLATTLFTIEQAALAAEAGCASISPFVHELKAFFDES